MVENFLTNFKMLKRRTGRGGVGGGKGRLWEKKKIEDLKVMKNLNLKSIINKPILLIPTQGTHVADSELAGLVYILSFSRSELLS